METFVRVFNILVYAWLTFLTCYTCYTSHREKKSKEFLDKFIIFLVKSGYKLDNSIYHYDEENDTFNHITITREEEK